MQSSGFSHTVRRQTRNKERQMPVLPTGGEDELNREGQVSSRRVAAASAATGFLSADSLTLSLISPETAGRLLK